MQKSLFNFKRFLTLLAIASFLLSSLFVFTPKTYAAAGINRTINFQGRLVSNQAGSVGLNVANGTYSITFSLYNNPTTGAPGAGSLWSETQSSVTVTDGIFRVALGSVTPIPANFNFNWDGLYLGIKVSPDASEMTPRIQMAAVPFAFNAQQVAGLTVQDSTSGAASTAATLKIGNATTPSTFDLGANSLQFITTSGTILTLPTSGTVCTTLNCLATEPYWYLATGVGGGYITLTNSTADLLIGGQSTASASFAVLGLATNSLSGVGGHQTTASVSGQFVVMPNNGYGGNASVSGNLTIGAFAASAIQSTNNQLLTIGGNTTGTITLAPNNAAAGSVINLNASNINSSLATVTELATPTTITYGGAALTLNLGAPTGTASISGTLLLGGTNSSWIEPGNGPLNFGYKSGGNAWLTAMTIRDNTGYVGIGTTSPALALHVIGTQGLPAASGTTQNGAFRIQYNGGAGALDMGNVSGGNAWLQVTNSTNLATYYNLLLQPNGGNVGIGNTNPTGGKLVVEQDIATAYVSSSTSMSTPNSGPISQVLNQSNTAGTGAFSVWQALDGGGTNNVWYAGLGGTATSFGGPFVIGNRTGSTAYNEDFRIASSGNVGIGTTSPVTQLDIYKPTNSASGLAVSSGDAGGVSGRVFFHNTTEPTNGFAILKIGLAAASYLSFSYNAQPENTSGTSAMAILKGGNVGIGTTSPSSPLQVGNDSGSTPDLLLGGGTNVANYLSLSGGRAMIGYDGSNLAINAGTTKGIGFFAGGTSGTFTSGTEAMYINSSGSVGIGTSGPGGTLSVNSTYTGTNRTANIYVTSANNTNQKLYIGINSNGGATTGDYASMEYLQEGKHWGNLILQGDGGQVGIGTASTSQLLTVAGNMTASVYYDYDSGATTYYLDPSNSGISLNVAGDIDTVGNITVGAGGGGKITVTTLDPLYTIDGTHYSTYVPSMAGVKEEVSSSVTLAYDQNRQIYDYVLDLNNQPVSSDVWLFARVVDPNISLTDVLLTPDSSAKTWYEKDTAHRTIVFYSDRPTDVSFRLTAPRFDYQNWANISDQSNPTSEALVAPTAQTDTWLGIATPSSVPQFTITGPLFDGNGQESFAITDSFNNIVKITQAFSDLLVANLQVGLVDAQQITTNALNVASDNITINGQNIKDYITTIVKNVLNDGNDGIVSPIASIDELHTNFISPVDSTASIGLKLDNNKLFVLNGNTASSSAVATIDNQGNATFSGQLTSGSLNTLGDATISGTLHAGKILASDIEGLNVTASTVSAQYITNITNIYSTGSAFGSNFGLVTGQATPGTSSGISSQQLASGGYIDISSFSGQLAYVDNLGAANAAFSQNLTVFGQTSLSDTSIVGQLAVNGSLILADNGINVLGSDLNLQPLRQGGLSIMGGLVYIDTDGNLKVGGNATFAKNVTVNGTLATNVVSPLPGSDLNLNTGNSNLQVTNASNTAVLSVNPLGDLIASGEGTFSKLNLGLVQPALAVSPTELTASGSAGTANVSAYQTQVTIDNPNVTDKSLIYITPTSSTNNQVLYLLKQVPGESFTVGLQNPSVTPIPFNWIIVN
jgi:hypothetical protein